MDAPQGNGLYSVTLESLRAMPRSDLKYLLGLQHGGVTDSPELFLQLSAGRSSEVDLKDRAPSVIRFSAGALK